MASTIRFESEPLIERSAAPQHSCCETAGLIAKLVGWSFASLFTLFCVTYPKQRVAEIWTDLREGPVDVPPVAASAIGDHLIDSEPVAPLPQIGDERCTTLTHLTQAKPMEHYLSQQLLPEVLEALKEGKEFVFVPIVTHSDHDQMVLITLDLKNGCVEYYDPRGRGYSDVPIEALGITLKEFRRELVLGLSEGLYQLIGEAEHPELVDLRTLLTDETLPERPKHFGERCIETELKAKNIWKRLPHLGKNFYLGKGLRQNLSDLERYAHDRSELIKLREATQFLEDPVVLKEVLRKDWIHHWKIGFDLREDLKEIVKSKTDTIKLHAQVLENVERLINLRQTLTGQVSALIKHFGIKKSPFQGVGFQSNHVVHQTKAQADSRAYISAFLEERLKQPSFRETIQSQ